MKAELMLKRTTAHMAIAMKTLVAMASVRSLQVETGCIIVTNVSLSTVVNS